MVKLKNSVLHDDRRSQIVSWGHWFALFNIFLVMILGSRYLFIADWSPTLLGRFYAILSCIGHFSFLTFVVYLVLLFPLSFFIYSSKWQRIIAVVVATIAITLLLIDIEVFARFRMHLNLSMWQFFTLSSNSLAPDENIFNTHWVNFFIFVLFILLLETAFTVWSWRKLRSLTKRRRYCCPFILVFILCFLSFHLIHIWADANFYRPITMQRSSLPVSHPLTARHLLEKYGFMQEGDYDARVKQEGNPFAMAIEYPLGQINYERLTSPYNILLIVVDNWMVDGNENRANQASNMPKLAAFAREHIQFTNHFSASSQAYLGEFSLFYGLDPNYYNSILTSHKSSVLIDTLAKQRYNLGLFAADGFVHPLYRHALLSNFSMPEARKQSNLATTNLWLTWYKEQKEQENSASWFSTIQYNVENQNQNQNKANSNTQMKNVDNAIAKVIDALQVNNEMDKTIVIITASNVIEQSVIKQGAIGQNVIGKNVIERGDRYFLRTPLQVPLIVAWPNKESQTISQPTSHVDIMPTLMQDALNVTTVAKQYSQGENLFSNSDGQNSSKRKWLIAGNDNDIVALYKDKTIVIDGAGRYQIYDLDNQLTDEKLAFSTFLQLVTRNRRFMVIN